MRFALVALKKWTNEWTLYNVYKTGSLVRKQLLFALSIKVQEFNWRSVRLFWCVVILASMSEVTMATVVITIASFRSSVANNSGIGNWLNACGWAGGRWFKVWSVIDRSDHTNHDDHASMTPSWHPDNLVRIRRKLTQNVTLFSSHFSSTASSFSSWIRLSAVDFITKIVYPYSHYLTSSAETRAASRWAVTRVVNQAVGL